MEYQTFSHSIGIDVGKRELVACIRRSNGVAEPPVAFPNSSIGIKKFIVHYQKYGLDAATPILLESSGPYHWNAARTLADHGYFIKVVNPLHTKQISRFSIRKRKTDKVDAAHLAFLASQNYGYRFMETEEMAKKKAIIRHYWKLRSIATNLLVHEQYLKKYRGIAGVSVSARLVKKCEVLKKEIVKEWDKGNNLKYLDSIPGVTPFLAANILAELLPLERFQRIDQIIAYAGLDPAVKQTGGKPGRHGGISKRGSPTLREALFLAAFGSFSKQPMQTVYLRYKERGLHHNAILCIIARKILRISVALLKKRKMFDQSYLVGSGE